MKKKLLTGILIAGLTVWAQAAFAWSLIGTWDITLSGDHYTKIDLNTLVFVETINEQGTISIETEPDGSARITLMSPSSNPSDGFFTGTYYPGNSFEATRSGSDWEDIITGSIDAADIISGSFHLEDLYYGPNADIISLSYTGFPVPIPSAAWILASGIIGLAVTRLGRNRPHIPH